METFFHSIFFILVPLLQFLLQFALSWWWLFLPFALFGLFRYHWRWWRLDHFLSLQHWGLLEVRIPQEVDNPFRRMESVLAGMWQVKIGTNRRERWLEGKVQLGISLDIVSLEGKTHFYVRTLDDDLELLKTSIYAQFPNAEITPAEDYSKQVPSDIPNKEWDLWASVYKLTKPDPYPIKTYKKFFEEQATTAEDEPIRVDPMGQLLEGMATLGPGEQMWIQIYISPRTPDELTSFFEEGRSLVNKIVRRPEEKKVSGSSGTIEDIHKATVMLTTGDVLQKEEEKKEELLPPEMRITPGERVIVLGIEEKNSKTMFNCFIRSLYIAKRDVFFGGHKATPMSYFNQFSTLDMNGIIVDSDTWTKVYTVFTWFLDKRRLYLRKRRQLRLYRDRLEQPFPREGGTFHLNIEEIATLFHFPGKGTAPGAAIPRVEAKKGEAPSGLPLDINEP